MDGDNRDRFTDTNNYIQALAEAIAYRLDKHDSLAAYPAAAAASVLLGLQIGLTPQTMADIVLELCTDIAKRKESLH